MGLHFSDHGRRLAVCHSDKTPGIIDTMTGDVYDLAKRSYVYLMYIAFTHDEERLLKVVLGAGGNIYPELYSLTDNKFITSKIYRDNCACLAVSPDGTQLVSGSGDGPVRIWDSVPPIDRTKKLIGEIEPLRRKAAPLVDCLLEELTHPHEVAERLRADPSLGEDLRRAALIMLLKKVGKRDG